MSRENSAGLGVNNQYGPRVVPDGAAGVFKTAGVNNELVIEISGENINDDIVKGFIPAGARPVDAVTKRGSTPPHGSP